VNYGVVLVGYISLMRMRMAIWVPQVKE